MEGDISTAGGDCRRMVKRKAEFSLDSGSGLEG